MSVETRAKNGHAPSDGERGYSDADSLVPLQEAEFDVCDAEEEESLRPSWHFCTRVLPLIVLLVAAASVDVVLQTRLAHQLKLYMFPLQQTLYPLMYVLVSWPVLVVARGTGFVTRMPTARKVWGVFAVVALLDGIGGMIGLAPAIYLNGDLLLLLGQLSIPIALAMSYFYLGTRYRRTHVLGVLIVFAAVYTGILPELDGIAAHVLGKTQDAADSIGAGETAMTGGWTFLLWIGLSLLAQIPGSFSPVYEDRWLKSYDLNPITVLAGVSPLQFVFSVLMLGLLLLPVAPPAPTVPFADFGPFLSDAGMCFLGYGPHYGLEAGRSPTLRDAAELAQCDGVWQLYLVYFALNVVFNLTSLLLIKETSANLTVLTKVLRIGLSAFLFAWPLLAGIATSIPSRLEGLALVLVALGIAVYGAYREKRPPPQRYAPINRGRDDDEYRDDAQNVELEDIVLTDEVGSDAVLTDNDEVDKAWAEEDDSFERTVDSMIVERDT